MSEILIKGIEMPEGCYYCPILIGKANCICAITGTKIRIEKVREELEDERMPDCPLKELPPHGELVERDKISSLALEIAEATQQPTEETIFTALREVPVILEATE